MTKKELIEWLLKDKSPDNTKVCDIVTGHELVSIHKQIGGIVYHVGTNKTTNETFINLNFN